MEEEPQLIARMYVVDMVRWWMGGPGFAGETAGQLELVVKHATGMNGC